MCNTFDIKDLVQIGSTLILSAVALYAPYLSEKLKYSYRKPKLKIKFKLAPPYCHLTKTTGDYKVYYFRFILKNYGKTYAEDCEVYLEKISKKTKNGKYCKFKNFNPVNLKWSGEGDNFRRTIYPDKEIYCDIGNVPKVLFRSIYFAASDEDQKKNKLFFEIPGGKQFSQWDCLIPGEYKIKISVYGKNTEKVSKDFYISWSGKWKEDEKNMFKQLVIRML